MCTIPFEWNKNFFTVRVVKHWNRLSETVWYHLETLKTQLEQVLGNLPQWPCAGWGTLSPSFAEHIPTTLSAGSSLTTTGPAASVVLGVTACGADSNNDDNKTSPFQWFHHLFILFCGFPMLSEHRCLWFLFLIHYSLCINLFLPSSFPLPECA